MDVDDVWWPILLRLPLKSLFICKSVCKLWDSIITNPRFRADYHSLRSDQLQYAGYFLYPTRHTFYHKRKPVRFYGDGTVSGRELISGLYACSACFPGTERPFICSSNGVLLCYSMKRFRPGDVPSMPGLRYYVCNPLTKDWRELPGPPTNEVGIVGFYCREGDPSNPGDSALHYEYEVVRVLIYKDESGLSIASKTRIELYSSNTGKWSVKHSPLRIGWNHDRYLSMVVRGVFYWLDDQGHFFTYHPGRNNSADLIVNCLEKRPMPPNVEEMVTNGQVRFLIGTTVNKELVGYVGGNEQFNIWVQSDAGSDESNRVWQNTLEMNFADLAVRCSPPEDAELLLTNPHASPTPGDPWRALVGIPNVLEYSYDLRSGNLERLDGDQGSCFGRMYNYFYCPYHLPSWVFRL